MGKEQVAGLALNSYTYDAQGRLGSVTQVAGIETRIKSFSYNRDGYLIAATSFNGGYTVTFGYPSTFLLMHFLFSENR